MNDQLEYERGEKMIWEHLAFASFMTECKESIGMWSMYAQEWQDGIMLKIPKKNLENG